MPHSVNLEIFNVKIFSSFILVTKIKNTKNYSQQNLDQPKIFCTVISTCPSSSCHVHPVVCQVSIRSPQIQEALSPRLYSQERSLKPMSK